MLWVSVGHDRLACTMLIRYKDIESLSARIATVSTLVQRLPEANLELLATLTRFLIGVVERADRNKMSIRNSKSHVLDVSWFSVLTNDYS